jgi:hypothetical protein
MMSHITTIKSNVQFKDKEVLATALSELKTQFSDLTYSFDLKNNKFLIRYPPIEGYQENGNLQFVYTGDHYQMRGDNWNCSTEFNKVTGQVIINYQKAGVQGYLAINRFSKTESRSEDGVILMARRY